MKIIFLTLFLMTALFSNENEKLILEANKAKYKQLIIDQKIKIIELSKQIKEFETCVNNAKNENELTSCKTKLAN